MPKGTPDNIFSYLILDHKPRPYGSFQPVLEKLYEEKRKPADQKDRNQEFQNPEEQDDERDADRHADELSKALGQHEELHQKIALAKAVFVAVRDFLSGPVEERLAEGALRDAVPRFLIRILIRVSVAVPALSFSLIGLRALRESASLPEALRVLRIFRIALRAVGICVRDGARDKARRAEHGHNVLLRLAQAQLRIDIILIIS